MTDPRKVAKPRFLFFVNEISYFFSHRLPVARAARDLGFDVHVAAHGAEKSMNLLKQEGFTAHDVDLRRGVGNFISELRSLLSIVRLILQLSPDVVHAVTVKPVLLAGTAARLLRIRGVVLSVNGLGFTFIATSLKARLLRAVVLTGFRFVLGYKNATTIVQNPDDREILLKHKAVPHDQIIMIKGSGVDCSRFRPSPEPEGIPIVVLASRMLWDKGVREFVEAARILHAQGIQARFVLVGDPDAFNPASVSKEQLEAWHRAGDVECWAHRDDMERVLAESHVVCLPSYREGLPKILIEGAASGRPLVTTDAPGCREIGRHEENALLVRVKDADQLATALKRLITDPAMRSRLGTRGREIVMAEFSEEHVVQATRNIYERMFRSW